MLFDVVYLDPAWRYRNVKTGGSHVSGAAQKYQTMALKDICAMPIKALTNPKGSVCFLWATVPLGKDPYLVLEHWGFTYKTEWFWHKTGRMGTGYWTRGETEKLLIGVRGKVPAWRSSLANWLEEELDLPDEATVLTADTEGHSRKPEAGIRRIEALTAGLGTRAEFFATHHSAAVAAQAPRNVVKSPWQCYGLDLGHNFLDSEFWDTLISAT